MIETALKNFTAELARKRREVTRLQEDLGDLMDHLAVIEALEVPRVGSAIRSQK